MGRICSSLRVSLSVWCVISFLTYQSIKLKFFAPISQKNSSKKTLKSNREPKLLKRKINLFRQRIKLLDISKRDLKILMERNESSTILQRGKIEKKGWYRTRIKVSTTYLITTSHPRQLMMPKTTRQMIYLKGLCPATLTSKRTTSSRNCLKMRIIMSPRIFNLTWVIFPLFKFLRCIRKHLKPKISSN